jgi:hypothetical protein
LRSWRKVASAKWIGSVVAELKAKGLFQSTWIIISAKHPSAFQRVVVRRIRMLGSACPI